MHSEPNPAGHGPDDRGQKPSDAVRAEPTDQTLEVGSEYAETRASGVATIPAGASFPGYEIMHEIHHGGQGVVYQAIQKSTKRRVALKVVKEGPFAGPTDTARFEREVEILGQFNHPNIVAIHDSGEAAGHFYYVMDYIPGEALDAYVASHERSVAETLRLFGKICEAVSAAHLRGIIHRDLKPGNIRVDPDGEPHILDFGLAKIAGGAVTPDEHPQIMTMTGQFVGSLPWASPEQAEGAPGKIDVRTDVYSLGVILYQMLTGRFPYEVIGNMRDVLDRIMRAEPARPSTLRKQINDEVETIVLKCLAKERERRYQSAGELARDVLRYLNGEAIEAKHDSFAYVVRKQLRKYKLAAMVVAAFVVVVTAGFVVSLTFWHLAVGERDRALLAEQRQSRERRRAEDALETAQAINAFLQNMLSSADPTQLLGPQVTVAAVLDTAAQQVDDGAFADQPIVEAAVRTTIGRTYRELGRFRAAEHHLRRAVEIQRHLHAEPSECLAAGLHNLADVLRLQGGLSEAEQLIQEALVIDRAVYGEEHQNVATALHNLAGVLRAQNRFAEAEPRFREALDMRRRVLGDEHRDVASSLNGLALCLQDQGKLAEAEEAQRAALTLYRDAMDADHPDAVTCQMNLAHLLIMQEKLGAAEPLLLDALERERRILPAGHPDITLPLILLGVLRLEQGRPAEAEPLLRECLAIRQNVLPGHWLVGNTQSVLGECLAAQQRYDEAERLLVDGYQLMIDQPGQPAPPQRRHEALERLVRLYEDWNRPEEADKWRRRLQDVP